MTEIGNVTFRVDAVITDKQYHEAMSAVSAANERMAELQAENAKLRVRLQVVLGRFQDGYMSDGDECPCDLCIEWGSCSYPEDGRCMFYEQLRALGVEVPS